MKTTIIGLAALLLAIFLASSCNSDTPPPAQALPDTAPEAAALPKPAVQALPDTLALDSLATDTLPKAEKIARPTRLPPQLKFEQISYSYDTINQGDVIEYNFKFTNTGERPLTIKEVTGSCGCTIGSYPFLDIAPGEQSQITARFDSKGKRGPQFTTVTVYSNAEGEAKVLSLKGVVRGPDGSVLPMSVGH